jgi:hypothetical protein
LVLCVFLFFSGDYLLASFLIDPRSPWWKSCLQKFKRRKTQAANEQKSPSVRALSQMLVLVCFIVVIFICRLKKSLLEEAMAEVKHNTVTEVNKLKAQLKQEKIKMVEVERKFAQLKTKACWT